MICTPGSANHAEGLQKSGADNERDKNDEAKLRVLRVVTHVWEHRGTTPPDICEALVQLSWL